MSTGVSSTDRSGAPPTASRLAEWSRAAGDVGALLRFRTAGLRGRSRRVAALGLGVIVGLTVASAWLPAYLPDDLGRRSDVLSLLPSALVGVLVIAATSAAASGGGRELVPREEAVVHPISPVTDHLGALLMAPLNIAWLLQTWVLLGAVAYVAGPQPGLVLGQVIVIAWVVAGTCLAQVVGWGMEWVRRGPQGLLAVRIVTGSLLVSVAVLIASGRLGELLDQSPTVPVAVAALQAVGGPTWYAARVLLVLVLLALLAVVGGALLAGAVQRRPARDQLRLETSHHVPRPGPTSDLAALLRVDRVGIWRSIPLRRGLAVLALMPGFVAVAGDLPWELLTILPGLVASGGALLFGVNAWCLDGRGALWRDSLPVDPQLAFLSRILVLVEVLLVATAGTIALASLRAGLPSAGELAAVAAATMVVVLQVVSASLRWSVRRPFAVDLRSARATPAPPLVMVGYSSRLALSTTLVGILFSVTARVDWQWSVMLALPMVLFSCWRLARTAGSWAQPEVRCRVVGTVAS